MSSAGMNNYKGVTYQAWAAMLLFLLHLRETGNFNQVVLEDPKWEDFTLEYGNGKKVICESKFRSRQLTAANIKSILQSIIKRGVSLKKDDEIVIICRDVSTKVASDIRHLSWFRQEISPKYIKMGFSDKEIDLLAKTSFFYADSAEYLYSEVSIYFRSLVDFWLPDSEVDKWIKSVFVDHIINKSAKGGSFSRADLDNEINTYRREKIKQNPVYDSERNQAENMVKGLLANIKTQNSLQIQADLTALSAQPHMMFILTDNIFEDHKVKLADWDFLWSKLLDRQYAFRIVNSFEKLIDDHDNAEYIIKLFSEQLASLTNKAADKFHSDYALQLVQKILAKHSNLADGVLEFIEKYLSNKTSDYFALESKSDAMQEKVEIAKTLLDLFKGYPTKSDKRTLIVGLIKTYFDIVQDDGEHTLFTPSDIFEILKLYIQEDFETKFGEIVDLIVQQYSEAKYYGGKFSGWELMGGGLSQSGDHYSVTDRHFIARTLRPVLLEYYENDANMAWNYILDNCITRKITDVSVQTPDFLGRAAIPILLNEFKAGPNSEEAFSILKDQMYMRKGIPSKFELIFQGINNDASMSDDKKWRLVDAFLSEFHLPISVFVEQVTSSLAVKGNEGALNAIKAWVNNPDYREQQTRHTFFVSQSMFKLLNTDAGSKTFLTGIEILKFYLDTDDYKQKLDSFHVYDITGAISRLIEKDFTIGIELVRDIYKSSKSLTNNQQLAVAHSVEHLNKEDKELQKKVYCEFLKPILIDDLKGSNEFIEQRFTYNYARELFVHFAEHLAELKLFDEALELTRIFVNDSNPRLENELDDEDGKFNYHARIVAGEDGISINTVRGWTAWVLQKYSVVGGRSYLLEVTDLVEKLTKDNNFYVRTQSTFALDALARNRHTFMPGTDSKERFISLELAQKIENIAFAMIRDKDNVKYSVIMKYILQVFGTLRTLSESEAMEMFKAFNAISFEDDINDIYSLLVYYALFRKESFKEYKFKNLFGNELYEKINDFDDTKFQELLEGSIAKGSDDIRTRIGWEFWQLPKKGEDDFEKMFALSLKYFKLFNTRYTHHAYERIYYFVHDNIEAKPNECLELWIDSLKKEREYLKSDGSNLKPHEWWPCHYNGEFLTKLKAIKGDDEYLEILEYILDYPDRFNNGVNPDAAYNELVKIGAEPARALLKKLSDIYPKLYSNN
jgi:hypothetical protein